MEENFPQVAEKVLSINCDGCGGHMGYSPEKEMLLCAHCGNTKALPKESDLVVEISYNDGITSEETSTGLGIASKSFKCKSCGSETAVEGEQVSFTCPFCGSMNVDEKAQMAKVIQPSGLLPFKFSKKKAEALFKSWIGSGWFHPNNLKKLAELGKMQGVYVPYWTFDASTESSWTADAGYYYYVTETYRDSQGNTQTRQVQKVRWVPASGYHQDAFDDVLVIASNGVGQKLSEEIRLPLLVPTVVENLRY